MIIEYTHDYPHPTDLNIGCIPIGAVFHGTMGGTRDGGGTTSLFLKTFDRVVNLGNPNQTWDNSENEFVPIRGYQMVEARVVVVRPVKM